MNRRAPPKKVLPGLAFGLVLGWIIRRASSVWSSIRRSPDTCRVEADSTRKMREETQMPQANIPQIPNVRGMTEGAAKRMLRDAGFDTADITVVPRPSANVPAGQAIEAVRSYDDDYAATLYVSNGPTLAYQPAPPSSTVVESRGISPLWLIVGLPVLAIIAFVFWQQKQSSDAAIAQIQTQSEERIAQLEATVVAGQSDDSDGTPALTAQDVDTIVSKAISGLNAPAGVSETPAQAPAAPTGDSDSTGGSVTTRPLVIDDDVPFVRGDTGMNPSLMGKAVDPQKDAPFQGSFEVPSGYMLITVGYYNLNGTEYSGALRTFGPGSYELYLPDGSFNVARDDIAPRFWCQFMGEGPSDIEETGELTLDVCD